MTRRIQVTLALAALAALACVAGALPALSPAVGGSNDLQANLKGKDEVPGPGAQGATGKADFKLKKKKRKICFTITDKKLSPDNPLRGHIHAGAAGVAGDIVVTLFDGTIGRPSPITGCAKNVSKSLIKQIKKNPGAFYCNLHTAAFPNGAIRGQLKQ